MGRKYKLYDLCINTITPIHIGDGNVVTANQDYICNSKDNNHVVSFIDKEKLNKDLFENLEVEDIDKIIDSYIVALRSNEEKNENLKKFIKSRNLKLEDYVLYENSANSNISEEIKCYIKTKGKPYIPGSSLKGVLRTAILYNKVKNDDDLKEFLLENKSKKNLNILLEEEIFGKSMEDSLRNIQITDSNIIEEKNLRIVKTKSYNFNKQEKGLSIVCKSLEKDLSIVYESLEKDVKTNVRMKIINDDRLTENINDLFKNLNRYNLDFIENEIEFLSSYGCPQTKCILEFYEKLKVKVLDNIKENNRAMVRLGMAKSYYNSSIGLTIPDKVKEEILDGFEDTKIFPIEKGDMQYHDVDYKYIKKTIERSSTDGRNYKYPITRIYGISHDKLAYPMGWVEIKFEEVESICK